MIDEEKISDTTVSAIIFCFLGISTLLWLVSAIYCMMTDRLGLLLLDIFICPIGVLHGIVLCVDFIFQALKSIF